MKCALLLLAFVSTAAFAAEPLLDYRIVAEGYSYKSGSSADVFVSTFPNFTLVESRDIPGGTLRWFEQRVQLSPEYFLDAKLIHFEAGWWRLDFQIMRLKEFEDGAYLLVPMCVSSQTFRSPEQMELFKTVDLTCSGYQVTDSVEPIYKFYLTIRAN